MTYGEAEKLADEIIEQLKEKDLTLEGAIVTISKVRRKLQEMKCYVKLNQLHEKP